MESISGNELISRVAEYGCNVEIIPESETICSFTLDVTDCNEYIDGKDEVEFCNNDGDSLIVNKNDMYIVEHKDIYYIVKGSTGIRIKIPM